MKSKTKQGIIVRRAVVEDVEDILQIESVLFNTEDQWIAKDFYEAVKTCDGESDSNHLWSMECGDHWIDSTVAGYIAFLLTRPCRKCSEQVMILTNLGVDPRNQRHGFALETLATLKNAVQFSPPFKHVSMITDLVNTKNLPMQKLLAKAGFICRIELEPEECESEHGYMEFIWRREWGRYEN